VMRGGERGGSDWIDCVCVCGLVIYEGGGRGGEVR
jgi:hypothetical protein